jgi:hypothetical protein
LRPFTEEPPPFYVPSQFPLELLELDSADFDGRIILPVAADNLVLLDATVFEYREFRMAPLRNDFAHDLGLRGVRPVKNFFSSVPTASTSPKVIPAHFARQGFHLDRIPGRNPVLLPTTSNDGVHRPLQTQIGNLDYTGG